MTERAKKLLLLYYKQSRKIRRVSGLPPLTFTAKNTGALKNYRIYGDTVNGESVGDRTGNLWDENYDKNVADNTAIYVPIYVGDGTFTLSTTAPKIISGDDWENSRFIFFLSGSVSSGAHNAVNGVSDGESRTVVSNNGYVTIVYRKMDSQNVAPWNYETMLNSGSTALPYEPYGYRVPVKVEGKNLINSSNYEIRGADVEYTVNNDKSITANGSTSSNFSLFLVKVYLTKGSYIISGCPQNGSQNTYRCEIRNMALTSLAQDTGAGVTYSIVTDGYYYYSIRIAQNYVCNNLTFYPMIRKVDIEDDTYEPYIENTEVDVILPGIAVTAGTNTLKIGTEVQPSSVEIKGRIKAAGGD